MGRNWRQKVRSAWAKTASVIRERRRGAGGVGAADRARRESDWETAIAGYRAYLRRDPRDFGVRVRLIKTLHASGRLDDAEALLEKTLLARPDKGELVELVAAVRAARAASVPITDYSLFRRGLTIPEPPVSSTTADVVAMIVDGRDGSPRLTDVTRDSLRRLEFSGPVIVWSDGRDERGALGKPATGISNPVLLIEAGTILDRQTLGWLVHALEATGAVAAYGDDDRFAEGEAVGWSSPAFHAAPHPLDIATTPRVPAAILFRGGALSGYAGAKDRRAWLMAAFGVGTVAHVPLLLATTQGATATPPASSLTAALPARILTIIPTRDEGAVLAAMIESLEAKAARPDQLDIVVVDNGSRDSDTLVLLDDLVREGRIRVLAVNEPFNWSRLNNLAAEGADAEILLFANNDMQMMTEGWDDRLRLDILQPGVGVVGARLVYPNGRLQHGGMALGALDGGPVHEGLGAAPGEGGPLDRWRRSRPAAAVTGAFMGVRREVFEQVGGFNAMEFAVGCNDVDFCLRIRAQGWSVLYAADLELIHRESHSRGHDDTEQRMRRARGELEALFRIWGDEARRDPGRNPHWINHETLVFHGIRQPDVEQVEAWIRRSVDLWRVDRGAQPDGFTPRLT